MYLHPPIEGVHMAGAAHVRARDVVGPEARLDARAALARLGGDALLNFDRARFERSSGVLARDWTRGTGKTVVDLGALATERALAEAGWTPDSVDVIVAATATPHAVSKCLAAAIGARTGMRGAALDVRSGGAGGLEAWLVGAQRAATGARVVVVASEAPSQFANPSDPVSALLFGDGAAVLCLAPGGTGGIVAARSATHPSPGRAFTISTPLPPDGDTPFVFEAPDGDYVAALDEAHRVESLALRVALENRGLGAFLFAPYFVRAAQVARAEDAVGCAAPIARALLADGGSTGCAAPLAVVAEARSRGALPNVVAALAVGGGICTCSLIWVERDVHPHSPLQR